MPQSFSFISPRNETIDLLQKDYECLQTFLATNISDEKLVQLLNDSPTLQQLAMIIHLLKTGEKIDSNTPRKKAILLQIKIILRF